ncbi:MAG: hypothetical protein D6681_20245 [Calditrichaeota bacterium]|nr:MAG: hypothetical protein D6681_20245 [Calditrichota bacterium]
MAIFGPCGGTTVTANNTFSPPRIAGQVDSGDLSAAQNLQQVTGRQSFDQLSRLASGADFCNTGQADTSNPSIVRLAMLLADIIGLGTPQPSQTILDDTDGDRSARMEMPPAVQQFKAAMADIQERYHQYDANIKLDPQPKNSKDIITILKARILRQEDMINVLSSAVLRLLMAVFPGDREAGTVEAMDRAIDPGVVNIGG